MSTKAKFYCGKVCFHEEIEKESWFDGHCQNQCFDCMAIVGKRQLETQKLLKKNNS